MQLNESNVYITTHKEGYSVNIQMPDGSRNYLHHSELNLESAIIVKELVQECSIEHLNLSIITDDGYYRLILNIKDCNDDVHRFHSRKLNLNDVIFERMQLLVTE